MLDRQDNLLFDATFTGRNGCAEIVARIGTQVLDIDTLDLGKSNARNRFAKRLHEKCPAVGIDAVERQLLQIADEHRKEPAPAGAGDGEEISPASVKRPELLYSEDVAAITVPVVQLVAGSPRPRWRMYLHWGDGRRECIDPRDRIDIAAGSTLWLHPQLAEPTLSMANSLCRWSEASRRRWLDGDVDPELPCRLFVHLCENIAHLLEFPAHDAAGTTATLALWVMLTYLYPAWPAVPYVHVSGTKESGKTRLFEVLRKCVFRPMASSNITGPALFRTLHSQGGTVLFDEAERLKQKQDPDVAATLSILLAGYKAGGQAIRLEPVGDTYQPVCFDVYGPKATACIVGLPPELLSRCITIGMLRAPKDSPKPRRTIGSAPHAWADIRDELHVMAIDHFQAWPRLARRSDVCPEMSGREYERWQPLLAIARWLDDAGMRGLHKRVEQFAVELIDDAIDEGVPDMEAALLQAFFGLVTSGTYLKASEILDDAKRSDPRLESWSPRGVSTSLKKYSFKTSKTNRGRVYRAVPEDIERIKQNYGLEHP